MLGTLVFAWSFVPPAILLAVLDPGHGWRDAPVYALAVALWVVADALGMYVQQRVVRRNAEARVANVLRMYAIEGPLALLAFLGALESDRFAYAFLAPFGVVFVFRELVRERRHRIEQQAELARAYHGTARLLGDMIEVDDRYTGLHSRGVVEMALAVADALGLDPAERRRTELAALLHDVGKIRTPKEILHKPGPAVAGGVGDRARASGGGRADAGRGRRLPGGHRRARASPPRAIRRRRVSRRPRRRADPARLADRLRLRCVLGDDDRPLVPRRAAGGGGAGRAGARPPARSSIPPSCARW